MTLLVLSTSSPLVSVSITKGDTLCDSRSQLCNRNTLAIVLDLLNASSRTTGLSLSDFDGIVVDIGPGGFSAVRTGIALAKSWGWSLSKPTGAISAFDLISKDTAVAVPIRRNEWIVRDDQQELRLETAFRHPIRGYGSAECTQTYPDASRIMEVLHRVAWTTPEEIRPFYGAEPLISNPKSLMGGAINLA